MAPLSQGRVPDGARPSPGADTTDQDLERLRAPCSGQLDLDGQPVDEWPPVVAPDLYRLTEDDEEDRW